MSCKPGDYGGLSTVWLTRTSKTQISWGWPDPTPVALPSEPWACRCGAGHGQSGLTWQALGVHSTSPAFSDHSSGSSIHPQCLSEVPSDCWSRTPWACLYKSNAEWPGIRVEYTILTALPGLWRLSFPTLRQPTRL